MRWRYVTISTQKPCRADYLYSRKRFFHLDAGQWTDDTSMMLCLSDCLIKIGGMNAFDQATRYLRWYRSRENACTGRCVMDVQQRIVA